MITKTLCGIGLAALSAVVLLKNLTPQPMTNTPHKDKSRLFKDETQGEPNLPNLVQMLQSLEDENKLKALKALVNLSAFDENQKQIRMQKNTIEILPLLVNIQNTSENPEVLKYALWLTSNLALDHESSEIFGHCGALFPLFKFLFSSNSALQDQALMALLHLGVNDFNAESIGQIGGIEYILDLIREKKDVQAIKLLTCLARIASNREIIMNNSGVELLIDLLSESSERILEKTLELLQILIFSKALSQSDLVSCPSSSSSSSSSSSFSSSGSGSSVLSQLIHHLHSGSDFLCEKLLRLFKSMLDRNPDIWPKIQQEGGEEAIKQFLEEKNENNKILAQTILDSVALKSI